ncbi:MAG: YihY/virulence factor BrkB family protein [Nitrospiraceae bacterium]
MSRQFESSPPPPHTPTTHSSNTSRQTAQSWHIVRSLVANTINKWNDDPGPRFAAALAFYTAFTIVPLVVLVVMVSASMMGEEAIRGDLHQHIGDLIGEPAANGLFHLIDQWRAAGSPLLNEVVALGVLILGTVRVMDQLQDALDCIWGLKPKRPPGMIGRMKQRFTSMSGLLGIAFILLASLTVSAWLSIAIQSVVGTLGGPAWIRNAVGATISFVIIAVLFALIYKWVPQAKVAWADVWIGAVITGALYTLGSMLIVVHLGHSALVTFYGGAGSLVLILLWAYYASQIFLFGAVFIAVYASHYGSLVRPGDDAVERSILLLQGRPKKPRTSSAPGSSSSILLQLRRTMDYSEVDSPTGAVLLVITLGPPVGFPQKTWFHQCREAYPDRWSPLFWDAPEASPLLCFPQTAKGFLIRLARENK